MPERRAAAGECALPTLTKLFKRYRIGTGRKGASYFRKTKPNKHTNHFPMTIKMGRERFSVHSDSNGHPGEALITYTEPRKPRSASARNGEKAHNRQPGGRDVQSPLNREDHAWGRVQASRVPRQRGLWGRSCDTLLCPSEPLGMHNLADIHFQRARLTRTNLVRMNFKDLLKCLCCCRFSQHWIMFSRNGPQVGTWIIFHFGRESGGNTFGLDGNFQKVLLNSL